jgi:hypothetical protein
MNVDEDVVWEVVRQDLPALVAVLKQIVPPMRIDRPQLIDETDFPKDVRFNKEVYGQLTSR